MSPSLESCVTTVQQQNLDQIGRRAIYDCIKAYDEYTNFHGTVPNCKYAGYTLQDGLQAYKSEWDQVCLPVQGAALLIVGIVIGVLVLIICCCCQTCCACVVPACCRKTKVAHSKVQQPSIQVNVTQASTSPAVAPKP